MKSILLIMSLAFTGNLSAAEEANGVQLCHIANAGFYMEGANSAAIIDGVILSGLPNYSVASMDLTKQIIKGEGRFSKLKLATASHYHPDHFDPLATRELLDMSPGVTWVLAPQVADMVQGDRSDIETVLPGWNGPQETLLIDDIKVEYWRVSHGRDEIQNLGAKITIDGVSFFHPGDIVTDWNQLETAGLVDIDVDVILVPSWFGLDNPDQMQALTKALNWRIAVPMHYQKGDPDWAKEYGGMAAIRKTSPDRYEGGVSLTNEMQCMTVGKD